MKTALGEIIAFTDSDCIPDKDWLSFAVKTLESGAERIAGNIEVFCQSEKLSWAEIYEVAFAFNQKAYADKGGGVTGNMITWKRHFGSVGYFNDQLLSGADLEWGHRAQNIGIPIIYSADVLVKHPARDTIKKVLVKTRRLAGGAVSTNRVVQSSNSAWTLLLRGFTPPVRDILSAVRRDDFACAKKVDCFSNGLSGKDVFYHCQASSKDEDNSS